MRIRSRTLLWGALAILGVAAVVLPGAPPRSTPSVAQSQTFQEAFAGLPAAPATWRPSNWDVQRHSRDPATWEAPEAMAAQHGPGCDQPGHDGHVTHPVSTYDGLVF